MDVPTATATARSDHPRRRAPAGRTILVLAMLAGMLPVGSAGSASATPHDPPAEQRQAAVGARTTPAPFIAEWSWPLAATPDILRPFEKPPQKWKPGHRGVDLSVGPGGQVAVLSPADGAVSFAGTVVDRGVLSIDHGDGRVSSFEPVATDLVKGQRVARGDAVAVLSATGSGNRPHGHCGRPCLHWGVRDDGEYVDPLSFVMDRRPSVLLPLGS